MSWPAPNYKTKAVATAKFFYQHFQKVDTGGEDLLTQAQFNEAIKNIKEDKSVNGGFDPEPPKWDDLEKDESGRIDLQEFTMACQQSWKNPPQP